MALLDIATIALVLLATVLLALAAVLLIEILAALLPVREPHARQPASRPRIAVLVPAHDEALVIAETLRGILRQLSPQDRLLVVADNCSDATAQISQALGAEVIHRIDPHRRGKSYALDFGIRYLSDAPPDVVIVVDADCSLDTDCLATIGALAFETGRPVQARYELLPPAEGASPRLGIAVFAAKVKNGLRPLGLHRLGLPCQLMGTGMAFPWAAISKMDLGSGELTEDLVLGLDLARARLAPEFCAQARVTSMFPVSAEGVRTQRARWETGHLATIFSRVPALVVEAVRARNLPLLALALDAAVPPLALNALALFAVLAVALVVAIAAGSMAPLAVSGAAAALFGLAVGIAWLRAGRDNITLFELATAPAYAISKMPLYAEIIRGKRISWIRSKRD